MKLRPQRTRPVAEYPRYLDYEDHRQRLLRWIAIGGTAAAAGGLLGCDRIKEAIGLEPDPPPLGGAMVVPDPPTPADDGTNVGANQGADPGAAVPEVALAGEMAVPEPPAPPPALEDTPTTTDGKVGGDPAQVTRPNTTKRGSMPAPKPE